MTDWWYQRNARMILIKFAKKEMQHSAATNKCHGFPVNVLCPHAMPLAGLMRRGCVVFGLTLLMYFLP
jgi:hypothetical protein